MSPAARPLRAQSSLGHVYKYRPSPARHPLIAKAGRIASSSIVPPAVADLSNWFPGIRNQGGEGACTGFATAGFREVLHGSAAREALSYRLSPAYLYARTRIAEGTWPDDSGASMADEFAVLQSYGVCPEVDMPYDMKAWQPVPSIADVAAVEFRIGQPCTVDTSSPSSIKTVLAAGMPVGIAIPVYQSFESPNAGGVLSMPNTATEALLGGHGVLVLGYDDSRQAWRVANQWGTGWGDGGFCWMPYGYEGLWWEAWTATLKA